MPKLIVLVGPPGSGKSTYAQKFNLDFSISPVRISQDDQGKDGHLKLFQKAIDFKDSIIIDRMNFDKKQRERYIKPAKEAGYEVEIVVFHVPRKTCFSRIMARENHPTINGASIIKDEFGNLLHAEISEKEKTRQANSALDTFFCKYERVEDTEADKVTRLGWSDKKTTVIICDLDGTLCNIDHRLHHVQGEKKKRRWDLFNKEIPNDSLNTWCADLIEKMSVRTINSISIRTVLCSGRVDSTRNDTEEWLFEHAISYDNLFMRHRKDFRQDSVIKEIILDFEILPRYNVLFAIDDRQQVVDMWRRRGLVCLQCAPGDF